MLFVLRILWKSALFGAVLFGLLVWGFGLPATWPWYVTIAAVVAGVIMIGAIAITELLTAVLKDAFSDDQRRQIRSAPNGFRILWITRPAALTC